MRYPVRIKKEKEGMYFVSFPNIPEALTQGDSIEDALLHAKDALESAMEFYFDDRRAVPLPSEPKRGHHVVELPASLTAKVLLLNEMIRQGVRPAELARRIGTTAQEVNRLTTLRRTSKIDRIDQAMRALGKRLVVEAA